jgi:uncharacterized protein (TIGR02145 family)
MKTNLYILTFFSLFLTGCISNNNDSDRISSLKIFAIEQTSEIELNGATYKVYNNSNELLGEYTTTNGVAEIPYLTFGKYSIEEVSAPNGFIGNQQKLSIELNSNYAQDVIFYYAPIGGGIDPAILIKLKYYDSQTKQILGDYDCIRIGEYYWTSQNLYHSVPAGSDFENAHPMTQDLLNKYLDQAFLDKSQYQLKNISDFDKYYGRYYSRPSVAYIMNYGEMHTESGRDVPGWGLPLTRDYQQLFAMCPFSSTNSTALSEVDVRFALGAKEGDNPLAFDITAEAGSPYKTYWFDKRYVTNMYKFNMMPGGARLNGDGMWSNGLGPNNGYWDGKKGDIYHLFYTSNFAAKTDAGGVGVVSIHDNLDTRGFDSYHMHNIRLARKLTDQELGYKLYINSAQTDIKKLDLDDPIPSGYSELPNGYIRGFYVQYILDNDNPKYSIQDIISFAKQVHDPAVN